MTFLPIVDRELRVASRRQGTYWMRAGAALGAVIVGFFVYLMAMDSPSHEFGRELFAELSGLALFYSLIAGVHSTSDCLSEEKREGTFGLLFLTDLKGYDVVLGKLAANSVHAIYSLMAIFPVMAVPLLLGGITNGEFWRMALTLLNSILFSLAAGIFVSSVSKSPRSAKAATFVLVLLFTAVLPGLMEWADYLIHTSRAKYVWLISPMSAYGMSFEQNYGTATFRFWVTTGAVHALTWMFLVLACVVAPRTWQDKPAGARGKRWRETWHRWSYGDEVERWLYRRRLLGTNAFYWLASRSRMKPLHVWGFLILVASLWTWGAVEMGRDWFNEGIYLLTSVVINSVLKFWVVSESGRRLGDDRKAGALELLLSTPLKVSDILHGQILALRRQFLWPVLAAIVVELIFFFSMLLKGPSEVDAAEIAIWIAGMSMFIFDLLTLPWVAMWGAISSRNPTQATGIAVVKVLILPWLAWIAICILMGVASMVAAYDPGWKFFLAAWFALSVAADLYFGISSWRSLHSEFRVLAVTRYSPQQTGWKRIFGIFGKRQEV